MLLLPGTPTMGKAASRCPGGHIGCWHHPCPARPLSCLSMQFFLGHQVCWYGLYPCPFWPGTQSHAPYITKHTLICKHTTCSRSSSAAVLSGTVQTRVASKCAYVMFCSSLNSCVELHHLPYYQWSRKLLLHLQLQVGPIGPWFEIPTESVNE